MRAADLFEQGVIPAEIARHVGVRHQIVSDWRTAWQRAGREALHGAGRAGRKPKLNDEQLAEVGQALANGAEANGYVTDLWTSNCSGAQVIRPSCACSHDVLVRGRFRAELH